MSLGDQPRPLADCEALLRAKDDHNRAMFLRRHGFDLDRLRPAFESPAYARATPAGRLSVLDGQVTQLTQGQDIFTREVFAEVVRRLGEEMTSSGVRHVDLRAGVLMRRWPWIGSLADAIGAFRAGLPGLDTLTVSFLGAVNLIRENGICLDMCPVSNTRLGVHDWTRSSPAATAMRLGPPVTINSDGPVLFGAGLAANLALAGLSSSQLETARLAGILSWFLAWAFLATGAHILWRASASFSLKPVKVLADGTYLAELKPPRKSDGPPVTVRVIEYSALTVPKDGGKEETSELFFLVTSLLDPEEYPALDLACCYPDRWGCETVIGHHKTDMGEGQPVLRSKDPAGAEQEMWALSAVYQALCKVIGIGQPRRASRPPGSASHTPWPPWRTPSRLSPSEQADLALAAFLLKILAPGTFVRDRPDRNSPRKTKKAGDYPARKPGEPSVTNGTRKIQFHLLSQWRIT